MLRYERALTERGAEYIAGIDEAGRGALAGPVVAAAVVLPPDTFIEGLNDSKQLSPATRRELFPIIMDTALAVGIGAADRGVIDALNIYRATQLAMASAVLDLPLDPDALLVDAMRIPLLKIHQESVIKGDSLSQSIAAASVIAKVSRDSVMCHFHDRYPHYGFDRHKGYATPNHLKSIKEHGPCILHRATFRGVKEHLPPHRAGGGQVPLAFERNRGDE
jgi:ribonuclease HII